MRLLLLLLVVGSGALPGNAPGRVLPIAPAAPELAQRQGLPVSGEHAGPGDQLRRPLPEAPAVLMAGQGVHAPAATLREGLNHRCGLELDPDGTPSGDSFGATHPRSDRDGPGAAHRHPCPAVPLFSSAIPPPSLG